MTVKSAKKHAARALKLSRCPDSSRACRPFLDDIEVQRAEGTIVCVVCKEELKGHDAIQDHMRDHFQAVIAPPVPPLPSVPPPVHAVDEGSDRRGEREAVAGT